MSSHVLGLRVLDLQLDSLFLPLRNIFAYYAGME